MKFSEKLERLRRGGTVSRYHTHTMLRTPNDAEHMYNVTILVDQIYQQAYGKITPANLLLKALYHDQAEYETGDIPGWVKRRHPELKSLLTGIESKIEDELSIPTPNGELGGLIKVADDLEHLWTCFDERRLGNHMFEDMFTSEAARIEKRILETSSKFYLWTDVVMDILGDLIHSYLVCIGEAKP